MEFVILTVIGIVLTAMVEHILKSNRRPTVVPAKVLVRNTPRRRKFH